MRRTKFFTILTILIISLTVYLPESMAASLTIATSQSTAKAGDEITITVNGSGVTGKIALSASGGTLDNNSVWVENSKATATVKVSGNSDIKITATPEDISDSSTGEALSSINATGATIKNTTNINDNGDATSDNTNNQSNQSPSETKETPNSSSNNNPTTNENYTPNAPQTSNENSNSKVNTEKTKEVTFKNTTNETMYTANKVNLRTQYGTSGSVVKTLGEGEELIRTGYSTTSVDGYSWSRVVYNGNTYYCITRSLTATKPEKNEQDENTTNETENEVTENTTNELENTTIETAEIDTENSDIKKLEVAGYTLSPEFKPNIYEYTVTVPEDIESLDVKAEATSDDVEIEIAGNTELKDEENVITVICYNKDTKNTTTYQIMVNKEAEENPRAEAILEAKQKRSLIIKIGIAIIIVLIILCIIVFKKSKQEEIEAQEEAERIRKLKEREYAEKSRKMAEARKQLRPRPDANQGQSKETRTRVEAGQVQRREGRPRPDANQMQRREGRPRAEASQEQRKESRPRPEANQVQRREQRPQNSGENTVKVQSSQKDRNEEFDEKLERIRNKQKKMEKGGKHF